MNSKKLFNHFIKVCSMFMMIACLFPMVGWADRDPMTKAGSQISAILFGTLGSTLCAIIIGATFLLAKVGKVSWERFVQVGLCTAGFLGAPSIVSLIQSWI